MDATGSLFLLLEYAAAAHQNAFRSIGELARAQSPLLASIRTEVAESIPRSQITGRDGRGLELTPVPVSISFQIDTDSVIDGNLAEVLAAFDRAGAQQERILSRALFSSLSEITDLTGNKVNAGGRPLSWDLITDMLEKMEISFDENGEMDVSVVLHPDDYARLQALGPPTREQQARHDAVLARKRDEWNSRKRRRRLR